MNMCIDDVMALAQAQKEMGALRKAAYTGRDFYFSRKTVDVNTLVAGSYLFFSEVVGQNNVQPSQTNMQAANQTSNKDSFLLLGVGFGWTYSAADQDVQYIINNFNLLWKFFNVVFFQGPPEGYPGGSAAYVSAASSLAAITATYPSPTTSIINGAPTVGNYFPIGGDGVLINPQENFAMILENTGTYTTATADDGGTGLTLTAWLHGYRIRSMS
jgi:hypothetical protein